MSSENYPLRRSGIYRNLPTFDPSIKGLKAMIVGATGISGFNTIRSLLDCPDRWSTIYALSRSPIPKEMLTVLTEEQKYRIKHVSIDLTASGVELASQLKEGGVEADYVFFYGYISSSVSDMDPKAEEELVKANKPIFENFLTALRPQVWNPNAFFCRLEAQTTVARSVERGCHSSSQTLSPAIYPRTSTTHKKIC